MPVGGHVTVAVMVTSWLATAGLAVDVTAGAAIAGVIVRVAGTSVVTA